jgi:O-antigen biosynthesis protein
VSPRSPDKDLAQNAFHEQELQRLERRLAAVESSVVFKILKAVGGTASSIKSRLGQWLLHSPFHGLYRSATKPQLATDPYEDFVRAETRLSAEQAQQIQSRWPKKPIVSILLPVYKTKPEWLRAAIQSVTEQTYPNWQLCIAVDDAQSSPELIDLVAPFPHVLLQGQNGISRTLNAAAALASGDWVGYLDHDDLLSPDCLHHCVDGALSSGAEIVYTDEDYWTDGCRQRPAFRPGWSPHLLLQCMYWGHFWMAKRQLCQAVGWFRSECDGSQDHDLALRLTDDSRKIVHVPKVLYHWRQHPNSTAAQPDAKPYALVAGIKAVSDSLERRGLVGTVENGRRAHTYRSTVRTQLQASIVICSRNPTLLKRSLTAVEKTGAQLIVVHHRQGDPTEISQICQQFGAHRLEWNGPFHFAKMNNLAASVASNNILLFLNDDVFPQESETNWLAEFISPFAYPDVGVVGAKLLYPDRTLQHSGIALGVGEITGHTGRNIIESDLWRWLHLSREVSAVTGACLAIRKDLFTRLAGFDERFPVNFNDTDLCLRTWEAGFRVVLNADVALVHEEAQTRAPGTTLAERREFWTKWSTALQQPDPFYNPNLTAEEQIRLNF